MKKDSRIYIAGHTGLVGSSILRKLKEQGFEKIITSKHEDVDLRNPVEVKWFMKDNKPEYVFICCGKVGGINANSTYPVDYLYDNMMMGMNLIKYSYENKVDKLMYLLSSCIYPKVCEQPIKEECILSGQLEITNEGYALAKISNYKLCQAYNKQYGTNFISVMPCSIFGTGESFDLQNSHLIPAIMRKMHEAKINNIDEVEIWGTGNPMRQFLYVDDLADGLLYLMENYNDTETINIGSEIDYKISDIALMIKDIVHYEGELIYNTDKPDGTMKKLTDITKISDMGWKPKIDFVNGLKLLYGWYLKEIAK